MATDFTGNRRSRKVCNTFHVDPTCDALRSHPRYKALLRKMDLRS